MNTSKPLKIYIIAGEPSGDLLGSRLMRAMMKKTNNNVEFYGLGGDTMETAGLSSLFDISDLAIMGLVEVIPSIPKVLQRINQTVEDIKEVNPDILITIDSWSFSARVHKKIRKLKLGLKQLHYVAPQVWAWKKKRARTMYKYIDGLMTLLPQEPKYFTPYNLDTTFVGHPVIESDVLKSDGYNFKEKFSISNDNRIICILPGSRKTEVSKLLPIFIESAKLLLKKNPDLKFVIPTVKTVEKMVKEIVAISDFPVIIVDTEADRYSAFKASSAAIAASGTVALELAIAHIPHIVGYKVSKLTAYLVRKAMNIEFVNLSNIMLGREIIPELLQENCTAGNIANHINKLLNKEALYTIQMHGLTQVKDTLTSGTQTPSENACDVILRFLEKDTK